MERTVIKDDAAETQQVGGNSCEKSWRTVITDWNWLDEGGGLAGLQVPVHLVEHGIGLPSTASGYRCFRGSLYIFLLVLLAE